MLALACGASHAQNTDDPASMMARIEAPQPAAQSELDALSLPALMARLHVPGLSIAVVRDYRIHWAKAYGMADAESGRPVDVHTRFQAASISKPVTAAGAMRLVQEKRLDLDADINSIVHAWQVPDAEWSRRQPVTPRSLFSHTSGADDGNGFPGYAPGAPLPTLVQTLEGAAPANVAKLRFARAPFVAYKYSGDGVLIMQQAMTELRGRPFADEMGANVLAPLQMQDSTFVQPLRVEATPPSALAHDAEGKRMDAPWHVYPEQASAGLWSTPSDLARFLIEIQTALRGPAGQLLTQASAREMTTPVGVGPLGVGLFVDKRGGGWYFSHSGSNWGYRAWMIGHLRHGYGVVIMSNSESSMPLIGLLSDRVARVYEWDRPEENKAK
jgi:CubicO group peptidase (beta-lactamase class C family)